MTRQYLYTRLSKIGATMTEKSKYELLVTESNGTERTFTSRDSIYQYYFTRKYGDEKKIVKQTKKYVKY